MARHNVVEAPPEQTPPPSIEGELQPTTGTAIAEYSATETALAEMRATMADKVWDLTTTAGNQEARATRLQLVRLRTALDAKRLELKRPLIDQGKLLDDEAKRIAAEILAMEQPLDELIKADEKRRDEERAERERAEAERLQAINDQITAITNLPLVYIAAEATVLEDVIGSLAARDLEAEFDEVHMPRAQAAQEASLALLNTNLEARRAADAQAAENAKAAKQIKLDRARDQAINAITLAPSNCMHMSAAEIAGILQAICAESLSEVQYGDRLADAQRARTTTIDQLKALHTNTLEAEARAAMQAELQADFDAQQKAKKEQQERVDAMAERIKTIRFQVKVAELNSTEECDRIMGILRTALDSVDPDEIEEWPELLSAFNEVIEAIDDIRTRKVEKYRQDQENERRIAEARLLRIQNATLREAAQAALDYFDDVDASEDPELIAEMLRSALQIAEGNTTEERR